MVQNNANSIIVPKILTGSPKGNLPAQKDDAGRFDKVMRDQLSQDEERKLTDKSDSKDQTKTTDAKEKDDIKDADVSKDADKLLETVCPPVVLQWMAIIPGENQNLQNTQNIDAVPNSKTAAQNAGESITAVLGNETKEAAGQMPMDGSDQLGQVSVLDEKPQNVQKNSEFQMDSAKSDVINDTAVQKQPATEQAGSGLTEEKELAFASESEKTQQTVEKLPNAQTKGEQGVEAPLVQSDMTRTETNSNPVQKPAVSDRQPTEFSRADYMDKLGDTVAKAITSGKQEIEIQLEPAHLGKLLVKVAYEAGKTAISIVCSETKTMQAMVQNAKELGSILESHMGTQTQIIVDKGQRSDYLEQQSQQEKNQQEQQGNKKDAENDDAETLSFLQQLRLGLV